jgi:hypothetical protein
MLPDYDPMQLNEESYANLGFFPPVSQDLSIRTAHNWIRTKNIPLSDTKLHQLCESNRKRTNDIVKECYILLSDDPDEIRIYIDRLGGMDRFFTREFSHRIRDQFLAKNRFRLQQYNMMMVRNQSGNTDPISSYTYFNVAVHIRRGDILHSDRWIDQQAFANVARHICQMNTARNEIIRTNIHVFSSGPNRDGNWSLMEQLAQTTTTSTTDTSPKIDVNIGKRNNDIIAMIMKHCLVAAMVMCALTQDV